MSDTARVTELAGTADDREVFFEMVTSAVPALGAGIPHG